MKHSMSAQIFSLLLAVLFVFCGIPAIAAEPQQESTDQVVSTNIPAIDKNGPSIEKDQGNIVLQENITSSTARLEQIELSPELKESLYSKSNIQTQGDSITPRQAPINNSDVYIINQESLRDGFLTTGTNLLIATKIGGVILAPGPDEAHLETSVYDGFVIGYEDDGSTAGYIVNFFIEGHYEFAYAFVNSNGEWSEAVGYEFDVLPQGVFETIEGTLPDSDTVDTHEITVDYDASSSYTIGMLRTGTNGFVTTVYDEAGEKVNSAECSDPSSSQRIRTSIDLPKPDGITGDYTYTVEVKAKSSGKTNIGYKLAYGSYTEKAHLFEGFFNMVYLPYYHTVRDTSKVEAEYSSNHLASDIGDYYLFDVSGNEKETITMTTTYDNYRYKVLNAHTLETIIDTKQAAAFRDPDLGRSYYLRTDRPLDKGTYILVVYKVRDTAYPGIYSIAVGQPKVKFAESKVTISPKSVVKGETYEWDLEMASPNGRAAYLDVVFYSASGAGWPIEGGYYSFRPSNSNTWFRNPQTFFPEIKFNFQDPSKAVYRADGKFSFAFTANKTGAYKGSKLSIRYYYEIGQPESWPQ